MIRLIRVVGLLLIGAGVLVLASYLIKPFRAVWPWLKELPLPIQIGLGVALFGFVLILGSLIWERIEDHGKEKGLIDQP